MTPSGTTWVGPCGGTRTRSPAQVRGLPRRVGAAGGEPEEGVDDRRTVPTVVHLALASRRRRRHGARPDAPVRRRVRLRPGHARRGDPLPGHRRRPRAPLPPRSRCSTLVPRPETRLRVALLPRRHPAGHLVARHAIDGGQCRNPRGCGGWDSTDCREMGKGKWERGSGNELQGKGRREMGKGKREKGKGNGHSRHSRHWALGTGHRARGTRHSRHSPLLNSGPAL
jgi:hypothetical protein